MVLFGSVMSPAKGLLTGVLRHATVRARQFALDPEAPALLIRCPVRARGTQRAVRAETHIVQQPERTPCRLNQPELKWIVQVHERSCKVVWINSDHICVLIETCAAIGDDASYPGA